MFIIYIVYLNLDINYINIDNNIHIMIIRVGKYDKEYYIDPAQMLTLLISISVVFLIGKYIVIGDKFDKKYVEPVNCSDISDILLEQSHINYCIYKKESNNIILNVSFN